MAHLPIPPEFLEPEAIRYAGASVRGGWQRILLAHWCNQVPWPDINNRYELMTLSGIQSPAWDRSFPILQRCIIEIGARVDKHYAKKTKTRESYVKNAKIASQAFINKRNKAKQLTDESLGANMTFTAAGAVSPRKVPAPGQSDKQAIDIARNSMKVSGGMKESVRAGLELESGTLTETQ